MALARRLLHGVSLIPVPRSECVSSKKGYVKVKLRFTTEEPTHVRSYLLQRTYGFAGPYLEEVYVLLPQETVYPEFSYFIPVLTKLQLAQVISLTAQLRHFAITDEDEVTLAYVLD
jgi:hypothetical protein